MRSNKGQLWLIAVNSMESIRLMKVCARCLFAVLLTFEVFTIKDGSSECRTLSGLTAKQLAFIWPSDEQSVELDYWG